MDNDEGVLNFARIDPAIEERVEALLSRMTLEEKVGQLVMVNPYEGVDWQDLERRRKQASEKGETFEFTLELSPLIGERVRRGQVGGIISTNGRFNRQVQQLAVEESRLGIPLLIGNDVIHGFRTIFPIPLAEACTWNPELLERAAFVAACEAAEAGTNWIYAPMVDIARDPRWGRIAEGAGEDPFLGMALARARVRGFQSARLPEGLRISACPKHYAGYGEAEGGRDYNTVDISERTLRDVYLPPFKAAFDAGAGSTMSAFNEIAGLPCTINSFLLRTVLREEWGWPGMVVSDYNAIGELVEHGVAQDLRQAAKLSILAGIDMDMNSGAYLSHLAELVEEGLVPLEAVNEAARRVLRLKFSLGLFERSYRDEPPATSAILAPEHRSLALEVAQQSMVLLKNEGETLPLQSGNGRVAVIGPLADSRADMLGTWAAVGQPADAETVLDGLRTYLGDEALIYEPGCSIDGEEPFDPSAALAAASAADVVIAVVGESAGMSGEARSRVHLDLPGRQQELVDALAAAGKPLVVVLMCGRPLAVPRLAEQATALLVAWHGGIRAGQAVADILFGAVNPSGKLTASWPRAEGQIPVYYAHKNTGRPEQGPGTIQFIDPMRSIYLDEPNAPLFPFGAGLSYTRFEYSRLEVQTPTVPMDGVLKASVTVQNSGSRAGTEIVQLYTRDLVGSVTRPVKELKGFQRVWLEPGEEKQVCFEVPVAQLGFHGQDLKYRVEPGRFKLWVGPDSTRGLEAEFEICP